MGMLRLEDGYGRWGWMHLLLLAAMVGCGDPANTATHPEPSGRVIAEIKTDYENGGIGLAAADVDRDGDIDLISVRHLDQGRIWLHRNDGAGHFAEGTEIGRIPRGYYGIGLAAADFDHDGDVDLALVKQIEGGKVVLLENKGNHLFY